MAGEFVLVTKSRFEQMKNLEKKESDIETKKANDQMQNLENKVENESERQMETETKKVDELQKETVQSDKTESPTPPNDKKSPPPSPDVGKSKVGEEMEQLVTRYPHLGSLFNILGQHPETLSWNENGSIIVDGEKTIYGSDIIDLVQDTINNKLNPIGKMAFYRAMAKLKVPTKLISHAKNKKILIMLKKPPSTQKQKNKSTSKRVGWITW